MTSLTSEDTEQLETDPSTDLFVGCSSSGRNRRGYFSRLTLMEVQDTFLAPPKLKTLRRWRSEAPDDFCYTVKAWQVITHEASSPSYRAIPAGSAPPPAECGLFQQTSAVSEAYARTLECARALAARAILFETPPSFTPTASNRQRIARFFEGVERVPEIDLAWEARGVWSTAEVEQITADLELLPCYDPVANQQLPRNERAYFKLQHAQLDEDDVVALADVLEEYARLFVVFGDSPEMLQHALRLVRML